MKQRERQHVGQMTDCGKYAVVCFRRQFVDIRPAQRPGALDVVKRIVGVFRKWRDDDLLALSLIHI